MATEGEFDPTATLSQVQSSLAALSTSLEPLFKRPWEDTLEGLPNGELDKAKMDILMAYAINDLVWIYLRMRGIDPSEHEVSNELERIKTYYAKVRKVEHPETRRNVVDKGAAGRFIKNSLPRSQHLAPPSAEDAKRRAEQEAEEREMGHLNSDMSYMSNRWKYVAASAEKIPAEEAGGGGEGGLEDVELGEDEETGLVPGEEDGEEVGGEAVDVDEIKAMGGDAEDFLRELEDDWTSKPPR